MGYPASPANIHGPEVLRGGSDGVPLGGSSPEVRGGYLATGTGYLRVLAIVKAIRRGNHRYLGLHDTYTPCYIAPLDGVIWGKGEWRRGIA